MSWSWGLGMSVSTRDMVILGPREVRTGDIQEKIGMSRSHECRAQSWPPVNARWPVGPLGSAPGPTLGYTDADLFLHPSYPKISLGFSQLLISYRAMVTP